VRDTYKIIGLLKESKFSKEDDSYEKEGFGKYFNLAILFWFK
jgi:hypothetical protein